MFFFDHQGVFSKTSGSFFVSLVFFCLDFFWKNMNIYRIYADFIGIFIQNPF